MKVTRRTVADISLLIIVNAMWAAQYAAYKVALERMGAITVSAWPFLLSSIVLLPFLLWERKHSATSAPAREAAAPSPPPGERSLLRRKNLVGFLVISLFGLIPASVILAWGEDRSTASNAAIIYLTVPISTAILASLILNERMTAARWGSLFISLVGVLILSSSDLRHLQLISGKFLMGNLLVFVACMGSSFYNVYCKELLRRFTPLEVLICGYLLTFVGCVPFMVFAEHFTLASLRDYRLATWLALIVLSVFSWGLAMVLWMFLLKRLDVSQASVSIYLLPFLGVVIAAVTLHERITASMIAGGMVTLAGTVLITSLDSSSA
jgi:drug/metabolite transporter (DMT)-like permease